MRIRGMLATIAALAIVVVSVALLAHRPAPPPYDGPRPGQFVAEKPRLYGIAWPKEPKVLFFGDSWAAGTGADSPSQGWGDVAGKKLGVPYVVDGVGSTGYSDPGIKRPPIGTYRIRLAKLADALPFTPNVIVLQGSINDVPWVKGNQLEHDAIATIDYAHGRFPDAQIVMVGPTSSDGLIQQSYANETGQIQLAAVTRHVAFVSPQGWFPLKSLDNPRNRHPNNQGHEMFADRVLASLRTFATSPPTGEDIAIWKQHATTDPGPAATEPYIPPKV